MVIRLGSEDRCGTDRADPDTSKVLFFVTTSEQVSENGQEQVDASGRVLVLP